MSTIFALATPPGRSGVAVVRISGPNTPQAVRALGLADLQARYASLRKLRFRDRLLDEALVLFFPAPNSFTGEHVVELHVHGSRAVIGGVLDALGEIDGLRPARAGEFARQAWRNGKMDLVQAEALQDLIDSETKSQRDQALLGLGEKGLSASAAHWREVLVQSLAFAEACIDFSEEEDIAADALERALSDLRDVAVGWRALLASAETGRLVRDGAVIVIAGPPNAGKSSLLNFLARQDIAIVSERAGTTRDAIEVDLDIAGYAVRLVDTAGIRETEDEIEREGILRAKARIERADLVIWLNEVSEDRRDGSDFGGTEVWQVQTKSDLHPSDAAQLAITTRTAGGCDALVEALENWVRSRSSQSESGVLTRDRHRALLARAADLVEAAIDSPPYQPEILAAAIREASDLLGELVGDIGSEEALDLLFSSFCIGK